MNIKIFRLRSGEEIIAEVVQETKKIFSLKNPMLFKTNLINSPIGTPFDMTVLADWLANTTTKETSIPKNHIVNTYDPTEDSLKLYNLQLKSEIQKKEIVRTKNTAERNKENDLFEEFLGSILNDISENFNQFDSKVAPNIETNDPYEDEYQPKKRRKRSRRKSNNVSPEMNDEELERSGIYISMMIPGETIMNLVTAGILSPKDLVKMINETKKRNRFTGDEKERKDFGNEFTDWNPDPKSDDYK